MKKSIFTVAFTILVAGTTFTSCSSTEQKTDEAKTILDESAEKLATAQKEYDEQYAKFKTESEEKIAANEKSIAELKDRSKKMKGDAKAEYEKTIESLEQRNETLQSKIEDYKSDGNEKWESFKREFNHDMDELGQALKDLTTNSSK